ncbi:MAG: murein biosynthesis integral membrane protein MurJ [Proteobacteria bacterium]|nr:murein biosynthesis integral membrane protein MurJ [Pseudomonadota bacterium]
MQLGKSIATVGGLTSVSRVFGLLREMLMSHFLGASVVADAFIVAFKFPNFFRRFFAEGAFNAAFVPEFAGILASDGQKKANDLANQVFSWLFFVLCAFVIFVVVFTPFIIHLIAPGFCDTPDRLNYAIEFTRITFPYILFISLAALLSGILNSLDRFAAAAATPVLLNIFMIGALLMTVEEPGFALCVGVILAGIVQFLWLYFVAQKHGFKLRLQRPLLSPSVSKILKLMLPGAIGAGVMQINIFIDMMLASTLQTGSLSYLYYADRLNQLPLSIFGVAIGTVLLPSLSKALRTGQEQEAISLQEKALSMGLRLSIPAAFGLIVLSYPIIDLIYGHGSFSVLHVQATAPALAAFAVGLPAYTLSKVFTTGFFAKQNTKTPLKIGMITVGCNLILNLLLIGPFLHVGMALATGIAAWVQAGLLAWKLSQKSMIDLSKAFFQDVIYVILASICMAVVVYHIQLEVPVPSSFLKEAIYVFGLVGIGMAIYGIVYKMCLVSTARYKKTSV